ncbi:MAG: hypothetical protein R3Y05_00880 [bacterium]
MEFTYYKKINNVYVSLACMIVVLVVSFISYFSIFNLADNFLEDHGGTIYKLEEVNVLYEYGYKPSLPGEIVEYQEYTISYFRFYDSEGNSIISLDNIDEYEVFNAKVSSLINLTNSLLLLAMSTILFITFICLLSKKYVLFNILNLCSLVYLFLSFKSLSILRYGLSGLFLFCATAFTIFMTVYILKQNESTKNKNIVVSVKA